MSWTPNNGIYMDAYYNLVYPKGSTHLDGIDKDAMEVIDDHWGQFPPQHPLVGHIVGIAYIILWMINLFGNGSVCYIFIKVQNASSFGFFHQHPKDLQQLLKCYNGQIIITAAADFVLSAAII